MVVGGNIKGAALYEFLKWYSAHYGVNVLNRKISSLSAEAQSSLALQDTAHVGILVSNWYEAHIIHELLDKIVGGVSQRTYDAMMHEGGKAVMQATLSGVYKFLFGKMMSPTLYARYAQKLWSRYYDTGTITKEFPNKNFQITTISDWNSHHSVLCDLNGEASRNIFEAMGCKDVSITRASCVGFGHTTCEFHVTWSG